MGDTQPQPESSEKTSSPDSQSLIHLIIKTAKEKETIDINADASIEDVSLLIRLLRQTADHCDDELVAEEKGGREV